MLNIQQIKNIRHLLTQEATEILVLGTVMSHLDYCISALVGLPDVDISKMQHIQNIVARMVVLNDVAMKGSNSRSILAKLHWLPVCRKIEYKILALVHKCLSSGVPKYLNISFNRISTCKEKTGTKESTSGEKIGRTENKA